MRASPNPAAAARNVELLERLLAGLPEDLDQLAAMRQRVADAATAFDPAHDPLATSLSRCLATLRGRADQAHHVPAAQGTEPLPGLAFHARETVTVPEPAPVLPEPVVAEAAAVAAPAARAEVHWDPTQRFLYEDVVRLFDLGDSAGAMISLERLLMLSPEAEELNIFLDKNGDLLLRLYRDALGSLDRVPVPVKDRRPVKIPSDHPSLLLDVLRQVDGHRSLRDIVRKVVFPELRTLIVISHLARSGFVEIA